MKFLLAVVFLLLTGCKTTKFEDKAPPQLPSELWFYEYKVDSLKRVPIWQQEATCKTE